MSQPSGFVPVNFELAGKILLGVGTSILLAVVASWVTGWFTLPPIIPIFSIALILVSLYMMFFVPKLKPDKE